MRPPTNSSGTRPYVNFGAFSHEGELAFVSQEKLWVLDGASRTLHRLPVPEGFTPSSPTFSHDGRWLAYLAVPKNTSSSEELWIAHSDGTSTREVGGLAVEDESDAFVGWSPLADVLAVVTSTSDATKTVRIVSTNGRSRRLAMASPGSEIENAVWSPNGDQIAVSTFDLQPGGASVVSAYPASGGPPTTWFSIKNTRILPGVCASCGGADTIADLAGWWSAWGIGFWVYSSGATHNNDDTPLEVLAAPGAAPVIIGDTLSDGTTDAIAAGPDGALAVVESSSGRELGQGKEVATCSISSRRCAPLPKASVWPGANPLECRRCASHAAPGAVGSGVTLDPAWSPSGTMLAYVKAPVALTDGWPSMRWYEAHELLVWDARTHSSRAIAGVSGAAVPTWSRDGKVLLYEKDDGLWLIPVAGGKEVEVEHPLYPEQQWEQVAASLAIAYYGQIAWTAQFDWYSP